MNRLYNRLIRREAELLFRKPPPPVETAPPTLDSLIRQLEETTRKLEADVRYEIWLLIAVAAFVCLSMILQLW